MKRMQLNLANLPNQISDNPAIEAAKAICKKLWRRAVMWYHWRCILSEEQFIIDLRDACSIEMMDILNRRDALIRESESSIEYHEAKRSEA